MRPVAVDHRRGKGLVLVHRCERCGHQSVNRVALDDPRGPDSAAALGRLMAGAETFGTRHPGDGVAAESEKA